jgi:hypothetical protein
MTAVMALTTEQCELLSALLADTDPPGRTNELLAQRVDLPRLRR